jgi:hypothetical protein
MTWVYIVIAFYSMGTMLLLGLPGIIDGRVLYNTVGFTQQYRASADLLIEMPVITTLHICSGCTWMITSAYNMGCRRSVVSPSIHKTTGLVCVTAALLCATTAPLVAYRTHMYSFPLFLFTIICSLVAIYSIFRACTCTERVTHIEYMRRAMAVGIGSIVSRPGLYALYILCRHTDQQQYLFETVDGYRLVFHIVVIPSFILSYFLSRTC